MEVENVMGSLKDVGRRKSDLGKNKKKRLSDEASYDYNEKKIKHAGSFLSSFKETCGHCRSGNVYKRVHNHKLYKFHLLKGHRYSKFVEV